MCQETQVRCKPVVGCATVHQHGRLAGKMARYLDDQFAHLARVMVEGRRERLECLSSCGSASLLCMALVHRSCSAEFHALCLCPGGCATTCCLRPFLQYPSIVGLWITWHCIRDFWNVWKTSQICNQALRSLLHEPSALRQDAMRMPCDCHKGMHI